MKDETRSWMTFAEENLESAKILLESILFNPCLQNTQQCVEKALKAILIERSLGLIKTHSISELNNILYKDGVEVGLSEDDCDFLDSIYIPSKYPLGNALPHFVPNEEICEKGLQIAERVYSSVVYVLSKE